jgi:hypothetical protein
VFAVTDEATPIRRGRSVVLVAYQAEPRRYVMALVEAGELLAAG